MTVAAPLQIDAGRSARVPVATVAERLYGVASAAVLVPIWLAARAGGAPPADMAARRGVMPSACGPVIWFHGASAGELSAALCLVSVLRAAGYRFTAAFTTTNQAGRAYIARRADADDVHALVPWDAPRWAGRALDTWRPRALFLIETELWPQLIFESARRAVPVFCASARIYPRDVHRYRLIRPLIGATLQRVTAVLAQDAAERDRFVQIGAPPASCVVAGNLKYATSDAGGAPAASLRSDLDLSAVDRMVVFGSVHQDEIALALDAAGCVIERGVRVVLAPRHPSTSAAVVAAIERRGWRYRRRTDQRAAHDWQVLVLDTMGELHDAYSLATIAVVGGGWRRHGGHNPFEPIRAGAPVLLGPDAKHFSAEIGELRATTPDAIVPSAAALATQLRAWLDDPARRRAAFERQRQSLPDGKQIAQRYLAAVSSHLEGLGG